MKNKKIFLTYLKNLRGWKSNGKYVIFAVDDYGNVRLDSAKARKKLDEKGLKIYKRFDSFDALETQDDLESLFKVLNKVKDKNNNPAVFSALSVCANIDFERIIENNYNDYYFEALPVTYEKLGSGYNKNMEVWKQGMDENLIHPEFHGKEHLHIKLFREKLLAKDIELITCIDNRSYTSISPGPYRTVGWQAAYDFSDFDENHQHKESIIEGLRLFEEIFGMRATTFNAPGGNEHHILHKTLSLNGIKYIESPLIKKEHQGNDKYKNIINYTGKKNEFDQRILVRNCLFEPTEPFQYDWVNYTLKQVEIAFSMKKPAIISSHRVNFCGHIDEKNRNIGLSSLEQLLKKMIERWPDIEFINIKQLGNLIENNETN